MNESLQQKLIDAYPDFGIQDLEFGIETHNGWYNLLNDLCRELKENEFKGKVKQIKQKFGGLRFYTDEATDKDYKIIYRYEEKSFTVCEKCGKQAYERVMHGWITVLCEDCYSEWTSNHL